MFHQQPRKEIECRGERGVKTLALLYNSDAVADVIHQAVSKEMDCGWQKHNFKKHQPLETH